MAQTLTIQFRGDVDEDGVLETLYGKSGFDISPNAPRRSADVAYAVAGIVLMAGQFAAALWQIHLAQKTRTEARAVSRAAERASRRPVRIELVLPDGQARELPTTSQGAFEAAVHEILAADDSAP